MLLSTDLRSLLYLFIFYKKMQVWHKLGFQNFLHCVSLVWVYFISMFIQLYTFVITFLFSTLNHFSFDSYLLSFLEFVSFLCLLLLIISFYPLSSSRMSDVNSVFLYLQRFALCPNCVVNFGEISMSCLNAVYYLYLREIFCDICQGHLLYEVNQLQKFSF